MRSLTEPGGVMTFELGEDPDLPVRAQAGHLHQRRIANGVDDVPFVGAGACVSDGQFVADFRPDGVRVQLNSGA